ncbi:ABC transporter substrate-binding protein (plasmid) [Rhodococcus globerulus]|uniref:ABC transporter substrate-binding protein n=1 Tax=Rhodococcus globerulus TaxID=33008 RepID=UPI0039EC0D5C
MNTAARALVDSLVDQDSDGSIVPWLAESWTVAPDATSFTFTLRQGVTFADGAPLDADAVKANFDHIANLTAVSALGPTFFTDYKETTVESPFVVTAHFNAPNAHFLQGIATMAAGLWSPASLTLPIDQLCAGKGYGTGPFTLSSYDPTNTIEVIKRPDYDWSSALAEHQGPAYLDAVVFKIVPESSTRIGSLTSGTLDGAGTIEPQDERRLDGNGFYLQSKTGPGFVYSLFPNYTKTWAQDTNVRRALNTAIDRAAVNNVALSPNGHAATSVLSDSTPGWVDLGNKLAFDPDIANAQLDSAGWKPGTDGIRTKNGERLSLTVLPYASSTVALELVQQQWLEVGVELQIEAVPLPQFSAEQAKNKYDLIWSNYTRADPQVLSRMLSGSIATTWHLDISDELTDLLVEQTKLVDPSDRNEVIEKAQNLIVDDAVVFPTNQILNVIAFADTIHGIRQEASSAQPYFYDAWTES